jgi:cytochrome b subunit of formate dehydrogenase/cytochrome c553
MTAVEQPQPETTEKKSYVRFTPTQRFEHMVLLVTFTMLGVTGLVQRYADTSIAQSLIDLMGGIESIRIVHRIMATILMAEAIFHGGVLSYKLFVLGRRATMIPTWRDARDAIHWIAFNLGLRKEHPHMPKYNFGEKAEYLAVVWGTVIMVITGFMLWNPITTAKIFPGEVIPAAQVAHSAEALLAVLSILIWHMYNVHLKHFNKSMFTGKLEHEAMVEEHGEELERILQDGEEEPQFPPEVIERRKRLFTPYATVMTIVLVGGLFWFVTYEETAIETVPRQVVATEPVDVDALTDLADPGLGAAVWQSNDCGRCHGEQAEGGPGFLGVPLAGTTRDLESFVALVRRGPADMPAFTPGDLSNENIAHIWAWLQSLGSSD